MNKKRSSLFSWKKVVFLLRKEKLNANERKELAILEKEASNLPTSESPEMIKAMEIIKQVANNLTK